MKRVLSIVSLIFMLAIMFPAESPAPIITTTTTIVEPTIGAASLSPTECNVVYTECPATVTECVVKPTSCPATETECVQNPTYCPALETTCVDTPTYCPMLSYCGGEGCTPGYWKQYHHFDSWPMGYSPDQLFDVYFDDAFPGMTLLEVLQQGGGGLKALGRHAVAALLNAASDDVEYDLDAAAVITMFNAALASYDYFSTKNVLEDFNEQGCPLN